VAGLLPLTAEVQVRAFDVGGDVIEICPALEGAVGAYRPNVARIIYIGLDYLADPPEPPEFEVNQAVKCDNFPERERPGAFVCVPAQVAVKALDLPQDVGQAVTFDIAVMAGLFARTGIIVGKDEREIVAEGRENQPVQQADDIPEAVRRLFGWSIPMAVVNAVVKSVRIGIPIVA
jgi:hypothetical protein